MPLVLAVTGNIACGKSAAGEIFHKLGIPVIDSDEIVHQLYASNKEVQEKLIAEFASLDRKEIGKVVFNDASKRKLLEQIIHPAVDSEFREWVTKNSSAKLLVNLVPLVFEARLESRYDKILVISCPEEIQLKRLLARRPDLDQEDARKIINSQMPQKDKISAADFHIKNDGDIPQLEQQIKLLLKELVPLCS